MVATDSQHVAIPAIFGKHEKAVRGARPELAKAPLSLKLSSPTMPPPAVTVAVDTPSCSPAATPPAGPGQPYGPEVHDEEHLVGAMGSGAMRGPTGSGAMRHYAPASKRHKKDRHIKDLKGGMPPLDINIKLDVIDEAELSEDSPRAGEGYDSDEETASDSSPARRNSDEVDRPRKRECGGLDRAPQAADLPLPGVMAVEHPSAMAPYAHPTKLVPAVPKDFANVHWEEVEYELDIADERWLQANEGLQLSESQLEFLIDRLEKLKAGSEPPEPPTPAPAAELQLQLPVQAAPFSVTPGQIAALASDTLPAETVAAVSDWWLQKLADRQRMEPFLQPLLRRLRPQTDFDNCDSAQCFRAHRRQRSIREQRSSVNYREMSTGEINRLARQESAEQRKLRLEADRRKRQQQKLRAAAREAAEAEKVDEATRKRKREEELREAEARKELTLQERVASVVERMVRIVIRDDREEKRQQRLAREAVAAEQRRIKQAAALRKRNAEQVRQALRSIVSQVEAINFKEQRLGAREAARLRREEASAKMAQLAQERLRDNSNSRGARQIRGPVRAIAYDPVESAVITACVDNSLWKGRLVADAVAPRAGEEDAWRNAAVEWTEIGTALNVVTQTVLGDHLFACDRSNTLWRRSLREDTSQPGFPWRHWGKLGTKQNGVMALTAAGEHLYAATNAGKLMRALAESPTAAWTEVGTADKVKAMTSVPGRDSTRKLQFALCADGGFWRREVSAPADGALDGPEDGQWLMLGTPATKLVVSNGMCATGSVVVGSDAHSLLCCGWAGAEGVADDAEAAKRPTQWRRCMPLPPILSAKPKPVGPRGRKKSAKAMANGEK